jgi:RNA polymerase-binding transcription factor
MRMNTTRLNHFKEKLVAEKVLLEEELNSIATKHDSGVWEPKSEAHTDGADGDEADMANFIETFESNNARVNSLEARYNQILAALERIEKGSYGICVKSGKPIEEDRLEANPAAETCKAMMNG